MSDPSLGQQQSHHGGASASIHYNESLTQPA